MNLLNKFNLSFNGFLKLENYIHSDEIIKRIESYVVKLKRTKPVNESNTAFFENKITRTGLEDLIKIISLDLFFYYNSNVKLNRIWLRSSYPNYLGSNWHQDTSLNIFPSPIIVAIPLQNTNIKNGALLVLPHSHTLSHPQYNSDKILNQKIVNLNVKDVLFFQSTLWHRGNKNSSLKTRDFLFFEFISSNSHFSNLNIIEYQKIQSRVFKFKKESSF